MAFPSGEHNLDPSFERSVMRTLGAIEANLSSLRKELLGNGQPGRIQILEARQAADSANHAEAFTGLEERLDKLETEGEIFGTFRDWRWHILTAVTGALLGAGVAWHDHLKRIIDVLAH